MSVSNYRELTVWNKAMDLVTEVYNVSCFLPKTENYGLIDQMRRAAVSIPSNIAEGQSRFSTKEFLNFLSIAQGSKAEVETQLLICVRLNYLEQYQIKNSMDLCVEIGKMLSSLMKKLKENN